MRLASLFAATATLGLAAVPQARSQETITLRDMGSFHVGGQDVELSGLPTKEVVFSPGGAPATIDPNGTYSAGAMYAQYFLPAGRKGDVPLLLWHGGGLTGATYETTPDGREGWSNFFIKKGWDTYVSDAVERGRAGWAMYPEIFSGEPVFLTKENPWQRFRIGAGEGSYSEDPAEREMLEGNLFPAEGYDNFVKQIVPRWTTTGEMTVGAYVAYIDKVCPCVIVAHSQGGSLAFLAVQQRPDKVEALVLIEPAGIGDPEKAAALKDVPMLLVYGDYIEEDERWPTIRANTDEFLEKVRAAGGSAEIIDLPAEGIEGNSHMLMMDRNNLEIAAMIDDWLAERGLKQE